MKKIDDVEITVFKTVMPDLITVITRRCNQSDFSGILCNRWLILGTSRQPFKMMHVVEDENNIDKICSNERY